MTNISNSNNNTHTDWRYVVGGLLLGGAVFYWMQDRRLITQEQRFAAERTAAADRAERVAAAERAERIASMEAERAERIASMEAERAERAAIVAAERAERKELYDRLQAALGSNSNAVVDEAE